MADTPPEAPQPRPTQLIGHHTVGSTVFPLHASIRTPVEIAASAKLEIEWIQKLGAWVVSGKDRELRGSAIEVAQALRPAAAASLARSELMAIRELTPWAITDDDYAAFLDICNQVLAGKGHMELVDRWVQADEIPRRLKDVNRKIGRAGDDGMTTTEAIHRAVQNELAAERAAAQPSGPDVDAIAAAIRQALTGAAGSGASQKAPPDAEVTSGSTGASTKTDNKAAQKTESSIQSPAEAILNGLSDETRKVLMLMRPGVNYGTTDRNAFGMKPEHVVLHLEAMVRVGAVDKRKPHRGRKQTRRPYILSTAGADAREAWASIVGIALPEAEEGNKGG